MRYIGAADYHAVGLCLRQFISRFQKKKGNRSVKYHNEISFTEIRRFCAGQNAEGILFIDYLDRGKTITGEYYSNLLTRVNEKKLREKNRFAKKQKSSFIRTMHPPTKVFWQLEN
jgi:hypothetical protein